MDELAIVPEIGKSAMVYDPPSDLKKAIANSTALDGQGALDPFRPLLADTRWLTKWISDMGSAMASAPIAPIGFSHIVGDAMGSLVLAENGKASLSLAYIDALAWKEGRKDGKHESGIVSFGTGFVLLKFISAPGISVRRYGVDVKQDEPSCIDLGLLDTTSDRVIEFDHSCEALLFENVPCNATLLRCAAPDTRADMVREFDSQSGQQILAATARPDESRIEMRMALLRAMQRNDAVPVFSDIAQGRGSPHLRWNAMREALALDCTGALGTLVKLARDDPDPEIRDVANQSLRYIEKTHPELAPERIETRLLEAEPCHA